MSDAVEALGSENDPAPTGWSFGGRSWTLPARLDIRAVAALQKGNIARALDLVLGKVQAGDLLDLETDDVLDEQALAGLFSAVGGSALPES